MIQKDHGPLVARGPVLIYSFRVYLAQSQTQIPHNTKGPTSSLGSLPLVEMSLSLGYREGTTTPGMMREKEGEGRGR